MDICVILDSKELVYIPLDKEITHCALKNIVQAFIS